jgi:hypothetical protein
MREIAAQVKRIAKVPQIVRAHVAGEKALALPWPTDALDQYCFK